MDRPQVFDQGIAGFVLQLLEGGRGDVDGQGFGLGFQVSGTLSLQSKHDLSHAVYLSLSGSIVGLPRRDRR
jgi:hypothetical protein